MTTLRLILQDQLSLTLSSLKEVPKGDVVMMCEAKEWFKTPKHHKKKVAFLLSAMRHFNETLKDLGFKTHYVDWDDQENRSFEKEILKAVDHFQITKVVLTHPSEYKVLQFFKNLQSQLKVPLEIKEDDRFLCSFAEFKKWAGDKKSLRMEFFYREMRKKHKILLEGQNEPVGGKWNYDHDNRQPPKEGLCSPKRIAHRPSSHLEDVLKLVEQECRDHFGNLKPFYYAVTRKQALIELEDFIENLLPHFGTYQDVMVKDEPYLYHSLLSSYLNAGLLLPLEICQKAQEAYEKGKAPLNSVEGFIRQILGWREYVRGIYWHFMPSYGDMNFLKAHEPVPDFFWSADTRMLCLSQAIAQTRDHAYSHHIQRLMVTGNFALLAGLDVKEVQEWYLIVYSDAYEWVEMPNTLGMALFGDGGIMASKPYAASGKYIHRMSNFCRDCFYAPQIWEGERACPFNALYWNFLARHRPVLEKNPRLGLTYKTWDQFGLLKQEALQKQAQKHLMNMRSNLL